MKPLIIFRGNYKAQVGHQVSVWLVVQPMHRKGTDCWCLKVYNKVLHECEHVKWANEAFSEMYVECSVVQQYKFWSIYHFVHYHFEAFSLAVQLLPFCSCLKRTCIWIRGGTLNHWLNLVNFLAFIYDTRIKLNNLRY